MGWGLWKADEDSLQRTWKKDDLEKNLSGLVRLGLGLSRQVNERKAGWRDDLDKS